ncbi:unnamed protein product [Aphanomyces euteiches]
MEETLSRHPQSRLRYMKLRKSLALVISCNLLSQILGSCAVGVNASLPLHLEEDSRVCDGNDRHAFFPPTEPTTCAVSNVDQPTLIVSKTKDTPWLVDITIIPEDNAHLINFTLPAFLAQPTDWHAIATSFQDAICATWTAITHWCYFLRLVVIPLLAVLLLVIEALMPHTQVMAIAAFKAFRRLDFRLQVYIVASLALSFLAWRLGYFRKAVLAWRRLKLKLKQAQRAVSQQVATKSKTAAMMLPHVAYVGSCYLVVTFSPKVVYDVLSHDLLFAWLSTFYPMYRSFRAVKTRRHTNQSADEFFERVLKLWALWSFYRTSVTCAGLFLAFVPGFILPSMRPSTIYLNLFLNWIHSLKGDQKLYAALTSYMHPYATQIQTVQAAAAANSESSNLVLRTLASLGVLSTNTANVLRDLRSQGPALFGLIFLVMPGFLTKVGCDLVGLAFPAYVVMGSLLSNERRTREWWVCYFTVVALFEYWCDAISGILAWIPLIYHAKLLALVWLQFPYFRGAQRIFDTAFHSILIDPRRQETSMRRQESGDGTTETPPEVASSS